MQIFQIPLGPFAIRELIPIADRLLELRTQYREAPDAGWILDILDGVTGEPVLRGVPLLPGYDLLWQYGYLQLGFRLLLVVDPARDVPTYESLGVSDQLLAIVGS